MLYLTNIDLDRNQLMNAVIHNVANTSSILNPKAGQICFSTDNNRLYFYDLVNGWIQINDVDDYISTITAGSGIKVTLTPGGDGDSNSVVVEHSDTSTVTNYKTTNTGNTVIQNVEFEFDTFGHITKRDTTTATIHSQNTDTGTSSTSFIIDADNTGGIAVNTTLAFNRGISASGDAALTWREDNGQFELYADGSNLANLKINDLTVDGTLTAINSNEVNIGDSQILLNADITLESENSSGGIAIKRLSGDEPDADRKDAELNYNILTNRWETTFGVITGNLVTAAIANKVSALIGDNINTSFVITHNLNTRDLNILIRQTNSPYAMVMTDVDFTTLNTITVKFAVKPSIDQYTITMVG